MSEDIQKIAERLDEAHLHFLNAVATGGNLGLADREGDKVRQFCRRAGIVKIAKKPRRWIVTPLGQRVRAYLQGYPS